MPQSVTAELAPLTEADFGAALEVAQIIWRAHYAPMIGLAQVDYMLGNRFTRQALSRYLGADDRWFDLLRVDGAVVGYCSAALTDAPGELKLEQLYLLPDQQGRGLGGMMLRHVEARARAENCDRIMLLVAKRNTNSIAVYERSGFTMREAVMIDIGEGYVMDDYVMEKRL